MKRALLLNIVFLLLLTTIAAADFTAVSQYSELRVCKDSYYDDYITVTNNGPQARQYLLQGASPKTFVVEPGQAFDVPNRVLGDYAVGTYDIQTLISDDTGNAKILKQQLEVIDCTTSIDIEQNSFSNCECTPTLYLFKIYNNANIAQNYSISVNLDRELYTLSAENVEVAPGQSFPVYVYAVLPCGELGMRELEFTAESGLGKATAPFYLEVRECYSYELETGKPEFGKFEPQGQSYRFCIDGSYVMPVQIANTGEVANNFSLSLDTNIANLSSGMLEIAAGGKKVAYIESDAPEGLYNITLDIDAAHGQDKAMRLSLEVVNCSKTPIESPLKQRLYMWVVILALIILILFIITLVKPRQKREEPEVADRAPLPWKWILIVALIIALIAVLFLFRSSIWGWLVSTWHSIWAFILLYWVYFVIGLVIMGLIILFYWGSGRTIKMVWFWVIIGLIVLFLVLSLCFFTGFCGFVQPNPVNETNATVYVESSTVYIWKKDTVETIDMSRYLDDPDEDEIELLATPVDNISVEIEGLKVRLIPEEGFFGQRTVNFIADDKRGGRAVSPDITLVILDEEATRWDPVMEFLSRYVNYIIFLVFILLIAAILLVLKITKPRKAKRVVVRRKKKK